MIEERDRRYLTALFLLYKKPETSSIVSAGFSTERFCTL